MAKSFNRRMQKRGKQVLTSTNRSKINTAVAINQTVVLATPVDTGQARAGWIASLGFPSKVFSESTDKSGGSTISANNQTINQAREEQPVFISNNVGHIVFLNAGSSAQAPAGFVEKAVRAGSRAFAKTKVFKI